ncbi:transposase [Polymorphospora rubra]|uniref:transposase n=1 Tax=Polymorphospora rubra TaxID=338584 RepID=UPI003404D4E7
MQPLVPVPSRQPQDGGKRRADDRAVLAAIVYLLQAGYFWPKPPAVLFGVSRFTVHRRFTKGAAWTWIRLHQQFLHRPGIVSKIDWFRCGREPDHLEGAKKRRRRNRPEPGHSRQARTGDPHSSDREGLPLTVPICVASTPDAKLAISLLDSVVPICGQRGRPR